MKEHSGMDLPVTIEYCSKNSDDYQAFNIGLLSLVASFSWETLQDVLSVVALVLFVFHAFCLRNIPEKSTLSIYVCLFLLICLLRLISPEAVVAVGFIGLAVIAFAGLVTLRKFHYRILLGFVSVVLVIFLNLDL